VGNPWIEANKKMYLTKLYRYLPTSLMTEDLFPQDAENNNGVNTTPSFFDEQGKVIIIIVIPLLMELGILLLIWYKRKWVK
jgi:ABC-type uncharacterized transport system involved in gliding motility auxiliary subunit